MPSLQYSGSRLARSKFQGHAAASFFFQSRLGWPFEAMKGLDASFGEVLQEFAANKGRHPSVFTKAT